MNPYHYSFPPGDEPPADEPPCWYIIAVLLVAILLAGALSYNLEPKQEEGTHDTSTRTD